MVSTKSPKQYTVMLDIADLQPVYMSNVVTDAPSLPDSIV